MALVVSLAVVATLLSVMAAPVTFPTSPVDVTGVAQLNTTYSGNATYFDDHRNGCPDIKYTFDEPVAAVSSALFGNVKNHTSVCGKYVNVTLQEDPAESFIFKIVDVCPSCDATSLDFSQVAMKEFTGHGVAPIDWQLLDKLPEAMVPTQPTATSTTVAPKPTKPVAKPSVKDDDHSNHHTSKTFRGRGTWFSDNSGSCGEKFSQGDMIVALNEAQMGEMWGKGSKCGQKLRVTAKGYPGKSVIVRIVDTCPHRYCSHGQLDLSREAFQHFAPMSKGVLDLEWSFV
ncbi:hypothetical protein BGZ83_007157 [Gryganskiella cystojenkinii]|nr:hypothetical protein BGZ83_007157 [Gryganskiella cystojenkinii]